MRWVNGRVCSAAWLSQSRDAAHQQLAKRGNGPMLRLLGRASSANVQKVTWALAEMDVPFERTDVGGAFGGNRDAAYLKLNPSGTIPTLVDDSDGAVVWESNTILRFLANRLRWSALYPASADAAARAEVERWMDWQLGTFNSSITPLFQTLVRTPSEQHQPAQIEQHRMRAANAMALLDGVLARSLINRSLFVCGGALTLADIALGPQVRRWFELSIERPELTALARWYAGLCERQAFRNHVLSVPMS